MILFKFTLSQLSHHNLSNHPTVYLKSDQITFYISWKRISWHIVHDILSCCRPYRELLQVNCSQIGGCNTWLTGRPYSECRASVYSFPLQCLTAAYMVFIVSPVVTSDFEQRLYFIHVKNEAILERACHENISRFPSSYKSECLLLVL